MKIIKSVLLFFILLHYVTSFTQEQNNQWRFGFGGGIDFNTNPPSFSASAVISTSEGSASVADRTTGALLFYTDGVTVWNANNQVMLNGTGLLGGTPALLSSTTAAVIIPKPGNSNLYYIVTIDEQASSNGMRYSLVDMTLDNGLGAVVSGQKNIFLFQTTSEKLEVVPASDKQSYWLLTHDEPGNSFFAFRINASGIQNTPVVSTVGNTQSNGAGHMKINRQFNKLAIGVTFSSALELFDFNNTTGVVSNPITWNYTLTSPLIYGVEFSPDGSKLYVTNLDKLLQFDISLSSASAIQNSVYQFNTGFALPAALQLGPDDKIYLNVGSISVINCPNSPGASCGFQENAIANQSGGGGYGLPKWVYYFNDHPVTNTILYSDTCLANSIQFSIQNSASITSVSWNFGDPASGFTNNAVGLTPSHTFSQAGNYTIQAILTTICGTDTLTLSSLSINDCTNEGPSISGIKLVGDTCDLPASIAFQAEGTSNSSYFFWNFDDPASGVNDTITITGLSTTPFPIHTFTAPGNYTVCVQFQEPGFPVTTVCKTISIGNCDTSTLESCALFVPNVFTPNGDQIHDSFYPELSCSAAAYELVILNRWGGEVFKTSVQTDKWDGKFNGNNCTNGVYFYKLAYQFPTQQLQIVSGIITLLR